jgi:hypothetical protein
MSERGGRKLAAAGSPTASRAAATRKFRRRSSSARAEDRSLDPLGAQVDGFAGEVGGSDAATEAFARLEDRHGEP